MKFTHTTAFATLACMPLATQAVVNIKAADLNNRAANANQEPMSLRRSLSSKDDPDCGVFQGDFAHVKEVLGNQAFPPSTIGVGSCWKEADGSKQAIERLVNVVQPDVQLWLGDNVYGDTQDMTDLRRKYDAKKQSCNFRPFLESGIPIMATWDDHDYGGDGETANFPKKKESQAEFVRHFNFDDEDPRRNGQEGVYSAELVGSKEHGRVNLILLDNRYHHSPTFSNKGKCEGDDSTMLGAAQWEWLYEQLEKESEVTIIGSGLQVLIPTYRSKAFGDTGWSAYVPRKYCAYEGDGEGFNSAIEEVGEGHIYGGVLNRFTEIWGEFPRERAKLFRAVQKAIATGKTKSVIFTSGDVHFAEIMSKTIPATDEYPAVDIHELTASGFNQNNLAGSISNANRVTAITNAGSNFGSIEIDWAASRVKLAIHTDKQSEARSFIANAFAPFNVTLPERTEAEIEAIQNRSALYVVDDVVESATVPTGTVSIGVAVACSVGSALLVAFGFTVASRRRERSRPTSNTASNGLVMPSEQKLESSNPAFDG